MTSQCPGCGLAVENGAAGCQALFDELLARDFSDYRWGRVHRLAVDVYCLQHPDAYCRSAKSLLAHLAGLCCALEHDADLAVYRALQASLNGTPAIEKPPLPAFRGSVTIADVQSAPDPEAYIISVKNWARSVWDAYAELHPLAHRWLERAAAAVPRPALRARDPL